MNLMLLKRFRNELIVLLATIFALYAFFYKNSTDDFVKSKEADIQSSISKINRVIELKKVWWSR